MSMTISVVTPTFNAQDLIAGTVSSVVNQSAFTGGRARLQYILQDGGWSNQLIYPEGLRLRERLFCE